MLQQTERKLRDLSFHFKEKEYKVLLYLIKHKHILKNWKNERFALCWNIKWSLKITISMQTTKANFFTIKMKVRNLLLFGIMKQLK